MGSILSSFSGKEYIPLCLGEERGAKVDYERATEIEPRQGFLSSSDSVTLEGGRTFSHGNLIKSIYIVS